MLSLSKIVASKRGKKIMARMYGLGASLVIIGALFKLQHWNYAGYMLSVGMITECIIFFFSAFEPVPAEYHWETVYPELTGDNPNLEDSDAISTNSKRTNNSQHLGGMSIAALDVQSAENLKRGVERFSLSMNSLSSLSTIGDASQQFASGLQQAAGNFFTLNQTTQTFSNAYKDTAQALAGTGKQAEDNMATLNKNLQAVNSSCESQLMGQNEYIRRLQQAAGSMDTINEATKTFSNTYNEATQTVANSGRQANENMAALNKNLQAVNTSYELYLKEHQEYVEHSKKLVGTMNNSAQQTQQFDQQMMTLNKLIAELNTTYASMVHTVNTSLKKK